MDSVSVSSSDSSSPDSEGLTTPSQTSDSQQNKVGQKTRESFFFRYLGPAQKWFFKAKAKHLPFYLDRRLDAEHNIVLQFGLMSPSNYNFYLTTNHLKEVELPLAEITASECDKCF